MCLQHYIKLIWGSPTTKKQNFHPALWLLSFKTRINWPLDWPNEQFSAGIFSTPSISKAASKLFGSQGCSDDNNWLTYTFPAFSLRFVDFAVQSYFRCKCLFREFFFREEWRSLRTVIDEIGLFCINNRLLQMSFLMFAMFALCWNIENDKQCSICSGLLRSYIKQIDHRRRLRLRLMFPEHFSSFQASIKVIP